MWNYLIRTLNITAEILEIALHAVATPLAVLELGLHFGLASSVAVGAAVITFMLYVGTKLIGHFTHKDHDLKEQLERANLNADKYKREYEAVNIIVIEQGKTLYSLADEVHELKAVIKELTDRPETTVIDRPMLTSAVQQGAIVINGARLTFR